MHIPSSMLHGAICPVTLAVGGVGIAASSYIAYQSKEKPSVLGFAAVTSMIFAAQTLNFPISSGTSGHLLGGVLAAHFLGIPFAILSMTIILAVQAVFFADGGVNTLGANVINIVFIGVGVGGYLLNLLKSKNFSQSLSLGIASWISVVLASSLCAIELALNNNLGFTKVFMAMSSVHALIGVGEAFLTAGLVWVISRAGVAKYAVSSLILALSAVLLSPFASRLPDGLNWVSLQFKMAINGATTSSIYPLSTILATFGGALLTFIFSSAVVTLLKRLSLKSS